MQPNKKCFRSEHQYEELFPRLPNEITYSQIVPKLPWQTFHILARVSPAWRKAIRDHRVYDARVRSCSTDTHVVHVHNYAENVSVHRGEVRSGSARIAVYSVSDKLCYDLPRIPGHYRGVPSWCRCVAADGKIYVLGGAVEEGAMISSGASNKVYVLDLAWASHWKECASMRQGRQKFGCAVLDGRIYAFGGIHNEEPVRGAEVYNLNRDAWSPIMPMGTLRFGHQVSIIANQIVLRGGLYFLPTYSLWKANRGRDFDADPRDPSIFIEEALFVEVYDPVEEVWTVDDRKYEDGDFESTYTFVAQGKFHLTLGVDMRVREDDGSFSHLKEDELILVADPCYVGPVAVSNEELFAAVDLYEDVYNDRLLGSGTGFAIFQSKGFSTENSKVSWKQVSKCPGAYGFMHCLQL